MPLTSKNKKAQVEIVYAILGIIVVAWIIISFNMLGIGSALSSATNKIGNFLSGVSEEARVEECPEGILYEALLFPFNVSSNAVNNRDGTYRLFKKSMPVRPFCDIRTKQNYFGNCTWKDLTPISWLKANEKNRFVLEDVCHFGQEEGENRYNIYCDNLNYYSVIKQESSNGDILPEVVANYTISFVMAPVPSKDDLDKAYRDFIEWEITSGELKIPSENFYLEKIILMSAYDQSYAYFVNYTLVSSKCIKNN